MRMASNIGSRHLLAGLLLSCLPPAPAPADEWLVYVGGGIEAIEGAWSERRGEVVFAQRGGTLVTVPYEDVDLATSAFVTWQLNGRRQRPPQAAVPMGEGDPPSREEVECEPVTVVTLRDGETFDVRQGKTQERVHAACLDTPETQHLFPELGWFGRATVSAVALEVSVGQQVCLIEQMPPLRDSEGHRVVHVTLAGGEDYAGEVIAAGLGLLRPAHCDRAVEYRLWENRAIAEQRGLWGAVGARPAFAAANLVVSVAGARNGVVMRGSGGG